MERASRLRLLLSSVCSGSADYGERLSALAELRRELETVETELAADALRTGLSWSQIGRALGVSKQTAHRRHRHGVAMLDQAVETEHRGRRTLVCAEAREAVRSARAEAAAMGQRQVGTEHLLMGILQSGERSAVDLLAAFGITPRSVRDMIQSTGELVVAGGAADGHRSAGPRRPAVLSPLARRTLERALGESARRPSRTLLVSDLLGALLRDGEGGAARTLSALGVDRREILARQAAGSSR